MCDGGCLKVGTIGTGRIGTALAGLVTRAGHQLRPANSHAPETPDPARRRVRRERVGRHAAGGRRLR
ncbi:hypothetical protein GO001_24895 [Streptomyces sp. NRRL B-1677]|uniref:Putative oxidoreductase/dehydrogenase Rossmann-like domain-containing protein n=1 Tax=Streptomyces klenkii TaxID=1420899 RepID=A0A3B0BZP8_9ACTN|nr:hypothetical protein [Streptomyces sp. NRRL B-1677]RKN77698.1 hypothetical protein D7231_03090 [Streptomyces klenkii]